MTTQEANKQGLPDKSAEPRHSKKHSARDPQKYADAIYAYSKLSASQTLYPGSHFENLAGYLQQPYEKHAPQLLPKKSREVVAQTCKFVSFYDLNPAASLRVRHIHLVSEFESHGSTLLTNAEHGRLLFMRGHPSPEWLLAIGTKCEVDPEFFQRHLDFRLGRPDFFPLPSLPSSSTSMFRLRVTTIGGSRFEPGKGATQETLDSLRLQNAEAMHTYKENLRVHSKSKLGDSIIRGCFIHDTQHFTIEQDISVYVSKIDKGDKNNKSWIVLAWLDNGNDLSEGLTSWLTSPLKTQSWQINYLPVIQYRPNIALKPHSRLVSALGGSKIGSGKINQSASLLHLDYDRNLDRHVAANNAFYSLHNIFSFVSFSENQFLNMMESKLAHELDHSALVQQKNPTLSNLLYNQQVLERHTQQLQETLTTIEGRNLAHWPMKRLDEDKQIKAETAAESLLRDYRYLLFRAETLSKQCNNGMQIVMNNANIKESREAISQAVGVTRLTRIAFIFLPLSLTTSLFGMNVVQFGTGSLSIWVWAVVSCPIFALSMLLMIYDIPAALSRYIRWKVKDAASVQH